MKDEDLIYLFTGTSEIFIKNRMNRIIQSFNKYEYTIIKYDMETTSLSTVLSDAITVPFLEELKIIILKNPKFLTKSATSTKDEIKAMLKYLKSPCDSTCLLYTSMGTVVGCCTAADLLDADGVPQNYNKIMLSDSIATCAGAVLGTSTVTTFVESGSGIAAGGKTGLTALSTAILFILAIFFMPLFAFIPSAACSAALVYVGVLMLGGVKNVDFSNTKTIVPAFITIVMMPFAYSITDGIGFGVISYVVINFIIWIIEMIKYKSKKLEEKPKLEISIVLLIIFVLFLVYFLVPTKLN